MWSYVLSPFVSVRYLMKEPTFILCDKTLLGDTLSPIFVCVCVPVGVSTRTWKPRIFSVWPGHECRHVAGGGEWKNSQRNSQSAQYIYRFPPWSENWIQSLLRHFWGECLRKTVSLSAYISDIKTVYFYNYGAKMSAYRSFLRHPSLGRWRKLWMVWRWIGKMGGRREEVGAASWGLWPTGDLNISGVGCMSSAPTALCNGVS